MILVIPSLKLVNGACSNFVIGESGTESLYSEYSNNPLKLCSLWRRENAKSLHITDVDSFLSGSSQMNINSALYIAQEIDIPIQYYADFKSNNECKCLLDNGIYRILITRMALEFPDTVRNLVKQYRPSRVCFCLITKNHSAEFKEIGKTIDRCEFARIVKNLGGDRLFWGDVNWMDSDNSSYFDDAADFAKKTGLKITLLNAANHPRQLWELNKLTSSGIDSVVMGKALYENKFPCQAIWRKIEAQLENNIIS